MPFDGFGVFQRVRNWVADATAGIKVRADYHDTEDDGFATGLSNCITRDGQSIITQNIPWNSKRITGLEDPVNDQDAVTKKYTETRFATVTPPVNPTDAANKAYVDTAVSDRVFRTGDTMTGALSVPSLTSGPINCGPINCGPVNASGTSQFVDHVLVTGGGQPVFAVHNFTAHQAWGFWVDAGGAGGMFGNTDASANPLGNYLVLTIAAFQCNHDNPTKPTGGPWLSISDARIKNVTGDYESGLSEVLQLRPVRYTFRNNVSSGPDSGGMHGLVAGKESIGFVAQEVETVMPEMVTQGPAYIDGQAVTDLRTLDTGPLIFALVNAVKELTARVEALET